MAKELKGTKTEQNLLEAFAGESMARNKYTYFASKARKDGYGFRLRLDNERSEYDCSIKHVYGVCDTFFGKQVSIVPAN